jgi:hypothetical protein
MIWHEFFKKSDKERKEILDRLIKNPYTNKKIKLASALHYNKDTKIYRDALQQIKNS